MDFDDRDSDIERGVPVASVWPVGVLCRAIGDALSARFNPVKVRGEISGFSRAASGHCYFTLKDAQGQLRCAMFRRSAEVLSQVPRDGELVEVQGRLDVYGPRGDLQLIVERLQRAGQGALFEAFLQRKAKLESMGLFDEARKRALPTMPRAIGLVTSLGAAALHDVATALQRRVPHIPVVLVPALVQGTDAPASLCAALERLYACTSVPSESWAGASLAAPPVDVILLVRGGGSLEDLWAFNDEQLAHTIVQSPVPLICGVGHETDFTIADFCADLRAPTPTAAAELVAQPQAVWLQALERLHGRMEDGVQGWMEHQEQRLDSALHRLSRPGAQLARQEMQLQLLAQRMQQGQVLHLGQQAQKIERLQWQRQQGVQRYLAQQEGQLREQSLRLQALNPQSVLERGFAWVQDAQGARVTRVAQARDGAHWQVHLRDGFTEVQVLPRRLL